MHKNNKAGSKVFAGLMLFWTGFYLGKISETFSDVENPELLSYMFRIYTPFVIVLLLLVFVGIYFLNKL